MELAFGIIIGLIILVFLVVVHELGHAIQAYRSGVVVEEFGVGFPPRALKKKLKNGILLTLNWLPIGGFVKLQGEYDSADKKGDYGSVSFWKKTKILLAGVTVNWVVAAVLLTILALTGLPKILNNQVTVPGDTVIVTKPVEITSLVDNLPAKKAGLLVGDSIIKFAGQDVPSTSRLIELIKQNHGKKVAISYVRKDQTVDTTVLLGEETVNGTLGAGLGQREFIKATWSAPIVGVATTAQLSWATIQSIGSMFSDISSSGLKKVSESVAGPISILGTIFPAAAQAGPTQLVLLTAIISISLAVMNILPIPSLDGGRWLTMATFKILKKKLTKEREEKIQVVGFLILMALVLLVTFNDVSKLF